MGWLIWHSRDSYVEINCRLHWIIREIKLGKNKEFALMGYAHWLRVGGENGKVSQMKCSRFNHEFTLAKKKKTILGVKYKQLSVIESS